MKELIIGLDLSLSCTGITIFEFENKIAQKIIFYRILFDDQSNKTGKGYTPFKLKNINDIVYTLPVNVKLDDIVIDDTDENNIEQMSATLRMMICSQKINNIIQKVIETKTVDKITFAIENYIMPAFEGKNQLKTVSEAIMLQGQVRSNIIKLSLLKNIKIKILTPTPSKLKKFFSLDGDADKLKMLQTFITYYNGQKILPDAKIENLGKINDVIDSFALSIYGFSKTI